MLINWLILKKIDLFFPKGFIGKVRVYRPNSFVFCRPPPPTKGAVVKPITQKHDDSYQPRPPALYISIAYPSCGELNEKYCERILLAQKPSKWKQRISA